MRFLPGVVRTRCGYTGGESSRAPSYQEVCAGGTRYCECVEVVFDSDLVSPGDIVRAALSLQVT